MEEERWGGALVVDAGSRIAGPALVLTWQGGFKLQGHTHKPDIMRCLPNKKYVPPTQAANPQVVPRV